MLNALKLRTIKGMPAYKEGMAKLLRLVQGTASRTKA